MRIPIKKSKKIYSEEKNHSKMTEASEKFGREKYQMDI
jgi:hypothetical protein